MIKPNTSSNKVNRSQIKLRHLFSAMTDVILVIDHEGRYLKIAPTNPSLLYKPSNELLGQTFYQIFNQEQADFFLNHIQLALSTKKPCNCEYHLNLHHQTIWFLATITPLDHDCVLWIARDITEKRSLEAERLKLEETLKANEKRFRTLIENLQVGIVVHKTNTEITLTNSTALELLGLTENQLLGKTAFDPLWNIIHEDGSPFNGNEHPVSLAIATKKSIHDIVMGVYRPTHHDRAWILVNAEPQFDPHGNIEEVICTFTNITPRKKAEEALRQLNTDLERRITQRTKELENTNQKLTKEITERIRTQENLTSILESITDGFVTLDQNWCFTYLNQQAETMLQKSQTDLLGKRIWQEFPETLELIFSEKAYHALNNRLTTTFEVYYNPLDAWFAIRVYPYGGGISIYFQDISEQMRTAQALQESEQRFRATFEQAAVGIAHISIDGKILRVNQKFGEILGYTREEILEKSIDEFTYPNDEPIMKTSLTELMNREIKTCVVETRYIHQDGSSIWVNVTASTVCKPSGEIDYLIKVIQDINSRKQTEAALRESQQRLQAILDNSPTAIYMKEPNGRYLLMNRKCATLFALNAEQTKGLTDHQIIDTEYADIFRQNDLAAVIKEEPIEIEEKLIQPDGIHTYISVKFPILDEQNQPYAICGISTDITPRIRAEEALRESLNQKELLLKEIHHRVKNNLQIVSSLLMLQADNISDPYIHSLFTDSQNRIYAMALIHEKLYRSTNFSKIDFQVYLQDLMDSLVQSYEFDQQDITFDIESDSFELNIESATPCGLLVNELVTNSLKHAFPNSMTGRIYVICHKLSNQDIHLIVGDTGIGLPPDFDLNSTKSLGFQLIANLTDQLGGTIEINSNNGTQFNIKFKELEYRSRF